MAFDFDSATNEVITPAVPLVAGVETLLWESSNISQGTSFHNLKVNVSYKGMVPLDTGQNKLVAVVMQQQSDDSWEEIGRQNAPFLLNEQGQKREIIVNPTISKEEGIDDVIAGMEGENIKLKSFFNDEATGVLKVCLFVKDGDPNGTNAFQSIILSVSGTRYDG